MTDWERSWACGNVLLSAEEGRVYATGLNDWGQAGMPLTTRHSLVSLDCRPKRYPPNDQLCCFACFSLLRWFPFGRLGIQSAISVGAQQSELLDVGRNSLRWRVYQATYDLCTLLLVPTILQQFLVLAPPFQHVWISSSARSCSLCKENLCLAFL